MSKKHKRHKKVSLPCDRNGEPINLGDWLMFDDGPIHVLSLTMYDDESWFAGDESDECAATNLSGGVVLLSAGKSRKEKKE